MNIPETYDYLVRSRRDICTTLERTPDEILSRALLDGPLLHSLKDLIQHIAAVEDGWLHDDILREPRVRNSFPPLKDSPAWKPVYSGFSLQTLLDYWSLVEQSTLAYLAALTPAELNRIVIVRDAPDERYTVDGLLWHVMIHEMRHSAQIAILLRTQHIEPPWLDLKKYLPFA